MPVVPGPPVVRFSHLSDVSTHSDCRRYHLTEGSICGTQNGFTVQDFREPCRFLFIQALLEPPGQDFTVDSSPRLQRRTIPRESWPGGQSSLRLHHSMRTNGVSCQNTARYLSSGKTRCNSAPDDRGIVAEEREMWAAICAPEPIATRPHRDK